MTQTSELVAGRELDALVSEKVMGKHVHDWVAVTDQTHSAKKRYACSRCGARVWGSQAYAPERYSTLIAAAWQVVDHMRDRYGFGTKNGFLLTQAGTVGLAWYCEFPLPSWQGESADTAPLAICRAALEAVGA